MTSFDEIMVGLKTADLHQSLQIAMANVRVRQKQVEASYFKKPIQTRERLSILTKLLNDISRYRTPNRKKINLLVFPEVSIPLAWESMIVAWARKHDIGVICGLEHRVDGNNAALNEVLAALPYKGENHHPICLPIRRLKRCYSPDEVFVLENEGLEVPKQGRDAYQLIRWRGASFAI